MTHYKQFSQGLLFNGYINTFLAWEGMGGGGGLKKPNQQQNTNQCKLSTIKRKIKSFNYFKQLPLASFVVDQVLQVIQLDDGNGIKMNIKLKTF